MSKTSKTFINFIMALVIFWGLKTLFPNVVTIGNNKDLFILAAIWTVSEVLLVLIILGISFSVIFINSEIVCKIISTLIPTIIIIWPCIKLLLLNKFYPGFNITGSWLVYIPLTIVFYLVGVSDKKNKKK